MLRRLVFLCLFFGFVGSAAASEELVRGVIISTHGGGRDWGSDAMGPTMADIKTLGANWVAIHPYGRIREDGSVGFRNLDPEDPPAELVRPIREAHALGLKICIKPHLAYWRTAFQWRGEIAFEDAAARARFWTEYRQWIVTLAEVCREADGFVIGTELDRTLTDEAEWRALIAAVRTVFKGALTYGANWTDYRKVPFWDALDAIGIQAYFPISEKDQPTAADLKQGWASLMAELRVYGKAHNRKIVFTELGYNQSLVAAKEPWAYHVDGEEAWPIQEACWRVALSAIENEPQVVGALLWKWFPYPMPVGRNFQLATPRIMGIIAHAWEGRPPDIAVDENAWEEWRRARRRRRSGQGRRE